MTPGITNSRYSQLSPCGYPAITDKIQIPIYRGLTENDSQYYGLRRLSLFQTQNEVPKVSSITRVGCNGPFRQEEQGHTCICLAMLVSTA